MVKAKMGLIRWCFLLIMSVRACASIYEDSPFVDELEPRDLYELEREQTEGLWIVQYYNGSNENVDHFSTNYSIAAKSMLGFVKSTSLNVEKHLFTNLVMKINKIPTYYFYGYYKHMPDEFVTLHTVDDLHEETSKQLVRFFEERSVYRFVQNKYNIEMGPGDLKHLNVWTKPCLVVFYKRDDQKSMEFSDTWQKLVAEFHEKFIFGSVNNPLYNVITIEEGASYPIIKYYPRGRKVVREPETYSGEASYDKLFAFLDGKIPNPKVKQITHTDIVAPCLKRKFCIFVFLPRLSITNVEYRINSVALFEEECRKYKRRSWIWFWNEYGNQPDIEQRFEIIEDDAINGTVTVLNVQAAVYAKYAMQAGLIEDILENISEGIKDDYGFDFQITATELPNIRTIESWNIKDPIKDEL